MTPDTQKPDDVARLIERSSNKLRGAHMVLVLRDDGSDSLSEETSALIRDLAAALSKVEEERSRERIRADANSQLVGAIERDWTERMVKVEAERETLRQVAAWRGTMLARYHDPSCSVFSDLPTERAESEGLGVGNDCNCGDQDALLRGNAELRAEREALRAELDGFKASYVGLAEGAGLLGHDVSEARDEAQRLREALGRLGEHMARKVSYLHGNTYEVACRCGWSTSVDGDTAEFEKRALAWAEHVRTFLLSQPTVTSSCQRCGWATGPNSASCHCDVCEMTRQPIVASEESG